mmetsp:Transcript_5057/g.14654  ORF Transcript_5057/g.14654 Transcript_5057/m.14654 type:complete len:464 (-) Transcript_5057:151-1542(-)|eukprot:CAMPEP_0172366326 /NCGR_PEP_ID=MMETSP1060-20121228/14764_1 /TAXON_ID=37318 /ORGANISM="Pseudo-nitzschia pungens, Strain cf. cingulata" /LENGTH=463 /DNA_ID=CAMNT_0013090137 /DNA_START=137 /DNA_END=1528 /DNA_ORIENTATION=-
MGQAISMAAVYCCCTAGNSLCQSCFGTAAVGTTGRKRSVLLLAGVIATSLWFQYSVGPSIATRSHWIWKTPTFGQWVYEAWHDPCVAANADATTDVLEECAGNAGVYRPTALSTLFFAANAVATNIVPTLNREAWPAKYSLFGISLLVSLAISSDPLFSSFYLWVARLGAGIFVVLQQVILIDVAYNWNDDWVEKANESDRLSFGSGSGWLHAIVGVCLALYTTCVVTIGFLYRDYTGVEGCSGNTWVITLTLLGIVGVTALQLLATAEGSLLTSGVISLYAVYLAFSIVSKNPSGDCNPRLGTNDVWGITIGLLLTTVSLVWTGWSWSAEPRLVNSESLQSARAVTPSARTELPPELDLDVPLVDGEEEATSGTVTTQRESSSLGHLWKLNVVLALVSCYVAMILTGWGTLHTQMDEETHNAANPTVGKVNMAILGVSQWLALGLYAWTLVAPQLFPDRDFS